MDEAISEDVFDYFFDVGASKILIRNKKYLHQLFERCDRKHL